MRYPLEGPSLLLVLDPHVDDVTELVEFLDHEPRFFVAYDAGHVAAKVETAVDQVISAVLYESLCV